MSDIQEMPASLVKTHDVIGYKVINPKGESLGTIEEIVLDKASGRTCYVVLTFGGVLGLGNKFFALPWQLLKFDQNQEKFILDLDETVLKNAPGFDKDHWPNVADKAWSEKISTYYGVQPWNK